MPPLHQFSHQSIIPSPLDRVRSFHESPEAFELLVPPPMKAEVIRDDRNSLTEGEIEFALRLGPVSIPWLARHEAGPTPNSFTDRMVRGPMAEWVHEHIFESYEGGTQLTDHISFTYPSGLRGLASHLFINRLALKILFIYRHWVTGRQARRLIASEEPR